MAGNGRPWQVVEECERLGLSFLSVNEDTEIPEVH